MRQLTKTTGSGSAARTTRRFLLALGGLGALALAACEDGGKAAPPAANAAQANAEPTARDFEWYLRTV